MMTTKTRRNLFALVLAAFVAAACGSSDVAASPADSQQYTTSSGNAEAANSIATALSSANRLVRDGKYITADSDGAGSSPINPGLKSLWDMLRGLRCAVWGNCVGVNMRTLKAMHIDGTGGATTTTAPAGGLKLSLSPSGTTVPTTAVQPGVLTGESGLFGAAYMNYNTITYEFVSGFNVESFTIVGVGEVDVTYNTAPSAANKCWATINVLFSVGAPVFGEALPISISGGKLKVRYTMKNTAGTTQERSFTTTVFCGA
jgi:hypothetical protein